MSVDEAADFIAKSATAAYRRECLKYWEKVFGEGYTLKVRETLRKRYPKRDFEL